jgi:tetratricopeptide (TPR) repeat protein
MAWLNVTGRSTITALKVSKTKTPMLEAYKKHKTLKDLEALLPGEADAIKQTLESGLQNGSSNSLVLSILAQCYLQCQEQEKAKLTLETLITQDPAYIPAKVELAKILFDENDHQSAIRLMEDATNRRPDIHENWQLLSEYLHRGGRQEASKNAFEQFDMIKVFNENLAAAEQAFARGEFEKTDKMCRLLLGQVPAEVRTLRLLAKLAKRFHHFEISTSILAQCIETQPANADLGLEYVHSLLANQKHSEALEQCERLIGVVPENLNVYNLKAETLYSLGRYEEAIAIYRELSDIHEQSAQALLHLGKLLKTVGETDKAISCYHDVVKDEQMSAQAYWELANLRTYRFSADEVSAMQALLAKGGVSDMNKVLVQFALGKALEDEEQFAASFRHYEAANDAYRQFQPFHYTSQNAKFKSFFTEEYFSDKKHNGSDSDAPIFVVGLPRSGSTLVEQILTAHSMVDATRELAEIVTIARELNHPNQPELGQYPQSVAQLGADQIQAFAQRYLDYAQPFRQDAPYFVDKTPGNFHHIGLIETLFPKAKIIDIRRNPMASGWSLYRHFFADSFLFSYDLETIGKYYNDYIELMDHWHAVLPGQILTINYEELIDDLPATVERLLQHCGLTHEQSCLDFHLNKRAVATPSSEQVRQPLYTGSLNHWKNYDDFLTPLKSAIEK